MRPWPPWAQPIPTVAALGFDAWPAQVAGPDGKPRQLFHEAELQWPMLRQFRSTLDHEIEPGETDTVTASFIVPCTIATARVATNLQRSDEDPIARQHSVVSRWFVALFRPPPADDAAPAEWWKVRSFVDVAAACAAKG